MQIYELAELEMNRDMDLARELLLFIESQPKCDGSHWVQFEPEHFAVLGKSAGEIRYHLSLLIEAGFIRGQHFGSGLPLVSKLTWQGHEFLDNIRDQDIWTKVKKRIEGLPSVALSVVVEIAKAEIKSKLGLP